LEGGIFYYAACIQGLKMGVEGGCLLFVFKKMAYFEAKTER
jgi:hypothetical protein